MNPAAQNADALDAFGRAVLSTDTRLLVLGALAFVVLFSTARLIIKRKWPSKDDAIEVALLVCQLWTVAVLFCVLVLTKPPAYELLDKFERESAGLLVSIFLTAGILSQIGKFWKATAAPSSNPAPGSNPASGTPGNTGIADDKTPLPNQSPPTNAAPRS